MQRRAEISQLRIERIGADALYGVPPQLHRAGFPGGSSVKRDERPIRAARVDPSGSLRIDAQRGDCTFLLLPAVSRRRRSAGRPRCWCPRKAARGRWWAPPANISSRQAGLYPSSSPRRLRSSALLRSGRWQRTPRCGFAGSTASAHTFLPESPAEAQCDPPSSDLYTPDESVPMYATSGLEGAKTSTWSPWSTAGA